MKNIRTKDNRYSGMKKEESIEIFPVSISYTNPTATSMPKRRKPRKAKNKAGKKSKSGFHWSERSNKWLSEGVYF